MSKDQDRVLLYSDTVISPYYQLYPDVTVDGEWVVFEGGKLIRVDNQQRREIIQDYGSKIPIDVIYEDGKFLPVYKGLRGILVNGKKYSDYSTKYGFKVLVNSGITLITPEGKVIEKDKPNYYRIFSDYISLVYDNYSLVVDRRGNVKKYNKPAIYLATTSLGDLYQTINGRIIVDSLDYDLLGVCSSDVYYLGESYNGIFISCEGKVKYFYKGGWSYLGQIELNPHSSDVGQNIIALTNSYTQVYSYNLKKIFSLKNIQLLKIIGNKIVALSRGNKIFIISPHEEEGLISVSRAEIGYKLFISGYLKGEVHIGSRLVETGRKVENDNLIISIEPSKLDGNYVEDIIKIINEVYEYVYPVRVESEKASIDVKNIRLKMAEGNGRYVYDKESNAVLEGYLNYRIKSNLYKAIVLKARNKEVKYEIAGTDGELRFTLPFYKPDILEETIQIYVQRGSRTEDTYELTVKPDILNKKGIMSSSTIIEDSKRIKVRKIINKEFVWEEREEYPEVYDNLVVGKVGDYVNVEGNTIQVVKGAREVEIKRDNIRRKYVVYGIDNPVNIESIKIVGEDLYVLLRKDFENIPVSGIYGTQMDTTTGNELRFKLDPVYDEVIVITTLGGLKWKNTYKLENVLNNAIKIASCAATKLKEELETFGIV
ncbi:protein UpsX [Stygiolobus caldivivus]|nr:hypothetical protein [Stygiolobus caldivivus]